MVSKAIYKFARLSPRKARHVADLIRGKKAEEAKGILTFTPKKSAKLLGKVLDSALANAASNKDIDPENLYVKSVMIDGGPSWKRFMPRAMGRASKIIKRTSHITVILDEK